MKEFNEQQQQYFEYFKAQLNQAHSFFSRLDHIECLNGAEVPEIRKAANALAIRKNRIERLKRGISVLTKAEFSAGLLAIYEVLGESIKSLKTYYALKINVLSNIYAEYEQGKLNSKEKIIESLKKIRVVLEDFTKNNYFMEELQYGKKGPSTILTKDQLISVSSRAEILEINLSQLSNSSIEDITNLPAIFNGLRQSKNDLEAKCTETSQSLDKIARKWFNYKDVFELAENKAVQTNQKKSRFGMLFNFFSKIQQDFNITPVQVTAEEKEAKAKEIRFTMLRK